MTRTVDTVREELRAAVERGFGIDFTPPYPAADLPVRRSAVLILFGALDEIPAAGRTPSTVPPELDLLLTRRSNTMRHHAGQIAFPGGGSDPEDADATATALREAEEETGLDPAGVEILGTLPEVFVAVSGNLVTPVIGWWRLPSEVAADHTESVEVFRVPVAELLDPAARGRSVLTTPRGTFKGAAFQLSDRFGSHIVWGLTGMLLSSVFDGVGWSVSWDKRNEFPVTG